jgi:6-pyruvoyl-tetrahydropterin synthase
MVKLSNFTSFFEVSIAVHLLYSLIPEVQKAFLAFTTLKYKYLQNSIKSFEHRKLNFEKRVRNAEKYDRENNVDYLWDKMDPEERAKIRQQRIAFNKERRNFDKLFRIIEFNKSTYDMSMLTIDKIAVEKGIKYIPFSVRVALYSLAFIIIAGYYSEIEIEWYYMSVLILITLAPMPVMLLLTYLKSKNEIKRARQAVDKMLAAIQYFSLGKIQELPM